MKGSCACIALAASLLAVAPANSAGKFADFDNDGRSDVFWRNGATGENYVYPLDGTAILGGEGYVRTVADQGWYVAGIGDFDGNGTADLLWRHQGSGENYIYFMNGAAISSEGYIRSVADPDWQVTGTGDFDGDDRDDILWRNVSTGENYVYLMEGLSIAGEGYLRTVADQGWHVAATGDFDGDGNSDILWRHAGTGENYLYPMNGTSIGAGEGYVRTVADLGWQVAGSGDFNGDARADILWRHASSGENYIYLMNGTAIAPGEGYIRTVADTRWQVAGVGDYDGDGRSDILWRNGLSGENYLYPMDGLAIDASEGYLRTVAALAWSPAGQTSSLTPALAGLRRLMSQMAQTINAQGEALARSHVLDFYDENFLADGIDRTVDSGFFVNDLRGLAAQAWMPLRVIRFDPAAQELFVTDVITMSDEGEAFNDSFDNAFKRQPDGSWRMWGNRRIADVSVYVQMVTTDFGPGRFQEGPVQKTFLSATAPTDSVAGIAVSGGGVFSDTPVPEQAGNVLELVQADPPPAAPEEYHYDSYFHGATTALSSPAQFTFTVTPASGPAQVYTATSNAVTSQFVTVTSPTGHLLADADLGNSLEVQWTLPAFAIEHIGVTAYARTVPFPGVGSQCHIISGDLPPTATSTTVVFPTTCNGDPVQEAIFDVLVTGVNGERTLYSHGFAD